MKNRYERYHVSTLLARIAEPPRTLIFVFGPRQSGKSTLVKQALALTTLESRYFSVDMLEPDVVSPYLTEQEQFKSRNIVHDSAWLIRIWQEARKEAERHESGFVLVLDEIQNIPQWSSIVKGLWDADRFADRNLRVVILGSSPLPLQQRLAESLAGRFELIRVEHWSFREMANAFNFDLPSYVYFGGYPGAAHFINDQSRWREYIRNSIITPNIDKDILAMTRVDKPILLKRTFELCSSYSGQILSYTKMLGQLQSAGNTTTLAHYLNILTHAGLLAGLEKYAGQLFRRRASSPKLNILNTALMSVNSGYNFEDAQVDRTFWGRLIESTVGAHLYNTGMPEIKLHYWRKSPHEVDFVLKRGPRLIGIEVKSASHKNTSLGLTEFNKLFQPECVFKVGGQGIPLEEFLMFPASHWFD
ncbi:MAG: ATP-binding protein [Gammaproteobacteria bacterium]|nr:ATP-binding protein [Gammaproteobacteria bacterium]